MQAVFLMSKGVAYPLFGGMVWNTAEMVRSGTFELLLLLPRHPLQSSVVREHARIPDDQNIMICIAMGYPDDSFIANTVKSVREDNAQFVHYVGFDEPA